MKKGLLLLLVGLALMASARVPTTTSSSAILTGELDWTHNSVCEWPPGNFLQYHVEGCDDGIFVIWDGMPADDRYGGATIEATGQMVINGSCRILVADELRLCGAEPDRE